MNSYTRKGRGRFIFATLFRGVQFYLAIPIRVALFFLRVQDLYIWSPIKNARSLTEMYCKLKNMHVEMDIIVTCESLCRCFCLGYSIHMFVHDFTKYFSIFPPIMLLPKLCCPLPIAGTTKKKYYT